MLTVPVWLIVLAILIAPWFFNPRAFLGLSVYANLKEFLSWLDPDGAARSHARRPDPSASSAECTTQATASRVCYRRGVALLQRRLGAVARRRDAHAAAGEPRRQAFAPRHPEAHAEGVPLHGRDRGAAHRLLRRRHAPQLYTRAASLQPWTSPVRHSLWFTPLTSANLRAQRVRSRHLPHMDHGLFRNALPALQPRGACCDLSITTALPCAVPHPALACCSPGDTADRHLCPQYNQLAYPRFLKELFSDWRVLQALYLWGLRVLTLYV